jgi:methylthioribose-1-phosphate isomerase
MEERTAMSFRVSGNEIWVLDQRALPQEENWLPSKTVNDMIGHIKNLVVRGAPLIAIAAVHSLAQLAEQGASKEDLLLAKKVLLLSRPTAVNLANAMHSLVSNGTEPDPEHIAKAAAKLFDDDVAMCERIAENGAALVCQGDGIIHHCNTGGLATAGIGTALGIIKRAHEQGKRIHVFVDETRPLLQGARLTVWELEKLGVPYSLIIDSISAVYMERGEIQKAFVGADRIALNGDVANKAGTFNLAIVCRHFGVPFYVAAPITTLDPYAYAGASIPIEERDAEEVRGYQGPGEKIFWSSKNCCVRNPAFDLTPNALVTAIVTDVGVYSGREIKSGCLEELSQDILPTC